MSSRTCGRFVIRVTQFTKSSEAIGTPSDTAIENSTTAKPTLLCSAQFFGGAIFNRYGGARLQRYAPDSPGGGGLAANLAKEKVEIFFEPGEEFLQVGFVAHVRRVADPERRRVIAHDKHLLAMCQQKPRQPLGFGQSHTFRRQAYTVEQAKACHDSWQAHFFA